MNTPKADASEFLHSDSAILRFAVLSQKQFFFLLFIYFGLQTLIRVLISGTVDLDESEQLILTQKFSWGYGSQPPLYTWIQMLFFKAFGISVFALALFKNLLLLSIYVFTYLNVRFVTRSHVCGMLGAISLLFIPQVSWESQRDLTHSVLASALVSVTLFVFLRLRENSWLDYAVFGVCAALGILSKYNYTVFLFGLILSALTLGRFRSGILNKRILLSIVACFLLLSPHLFWDFNNRALLISTAYKFHQQQNNVWFSAVVSGLKHLALALVSHLGPCVIILTMFFREQLFRKTTLNKNNDYAKLIARKYWFIGAGLVLGILLFQITGFKDRWFEPIFISLPLFLFVLAQDWMMPAHAKNFFLIGGVVALLVLILIPMRIILADEAGWTQLLNAPYRELSPKLNAVIPSDALVVAENKWIGGNIRLLFPDRNVVTPELAKLFSATNRNCAVVWDANQRPAPALPFRQFVRDFSGSDLNKTQPAFVEAVYQFHRAKKFRLGISSSNR
ncbi:MAG: glycosyltransferase family 39 protein [Verrucomicrobiota bacterium]